MSRLVLAGLVFLAIGLTGCKIQVIANTGGTVETQSGDFSCAPGPACEVEVNNTEFDETFIGKPDPGLIFIGWKKRDRGFCGGSRSPCRLLIPEVLLDVLLPFINSDEEFYLEAQFGERQEGDGPITDGNASACYNPRLVQQGTRFEAVYVSTSVGHSDSDSFTHDEFVDGSAMFRGQSVTLTTIDFETIPRSVSSTEKNYYKVQPALKRLITVARESIDSFGGTGVETYTPGLLFRYDLKSGDSFVQVQDVELVQRLGGQDVVSSSSLTRTIIFVGIQEITVEAGVFRACRFEIENIIRFTGQEISSYQTIWLAVRDGVLLRDISDESGTELVEGKLNGRTL